MSLDIRPVNHRSAQVNSGLLAVVAARPPTTSITVGAVTAIGVPCRHQRVGVLVTPAGEHRPAQFIRGR
jgi:hypothetical protein